MKLIQKNNKEVCKMEDFFDNFDDDFDEGEFMDEDSFEESFEEELEMDDTLEGDNKSDDEPEQAESQDNSFTAKDAFLLGGAMGFAYEEGLEEGKRRKLEKENEKGKEMNDKDEQS